ncbi:MAG: TetR family transcriptional regulator [Paraglaciecola sp.]|uniref:TetR family transcriptional regulator n=1 Tax=Paraglaciecola sp. TaxID=1920173 RepID=UPI003298EAED
MSLVTKQQKIRRTQAEIRVFREKALLRAALVTVAKFDIEGATVARICAEADASRGLITHYFDNKEDLLVAALSNLFNEAQSFKDAIARDDNLSAITRIHDIANSSFQAPVYTWEMAAAWQAYSNASRFNKAYQEPIRLSTQKFINTVAPLFKLLAAEQPLRLQPEEAARGLFIFINGLWNSMASEENDIRAEEAIMQCDVYINGCLK